MASPTGPSDNPSSRRAVTDGTPLRPSSLYFWCLALGLLGAASLLFALVEPATARNQIRLAVIEIGFAFSGAGLLLMVVMRKAPSGHVQLDAPGITFDFVHWSCTLPWHRITRVDVGWNVIRLHVAGDLRALPITPPDQRELALRRMSAMESFLGTPFVIYPFMHRLPKAAFLDAIERHRSTEARNAAHGKG